MWRIRTQKGHVSLCTLFDFGFGQSAPIVFKFSLPLLMYFFQTATTPDSAGPGEASRVASIVFLHRVVVGISPAATFRALLLVSHGACDRGLFHLVWTQLGMSKFSFFGCFPLTFGLSNGTAKSMSTNKSFSTRPSKHHLLSRCFRSPLSDYLLSLQTLVVQRQNCGRHANKSSPLNYSGLPNSPKAIMINRMLQMVFPHPNV